MKLTILGSGTCASQLAGIPNRYPPAFIVEWERERMLFDCSEGVRFRLEQAGYDYAAIRHIAISHSHPDHYALTHYVQSVFCKGLWGGKDPKSKDDEQSRQDTLFIYCPPTIADEFQTLWNIYIPDSKDRYFPWPTLVFCPMAANETSYRVGQGVLTARKVHHGHGRVDARAYRLETPEGTFVYSGDTGECPGIREIAAGADCFVVECSARIGDEETPIGYGHLNPRLVGDIAKEARVKRVVIFHYTGLDGDEAMAEEVRRAGYTGEFIVGKDFQAIKF